MSRGAIIDYRSPRRAADERGGLLAPPPMPMCPQCNIRLEFHCGYWRHSEKTSKPRHKDCHVSALLAPPTWK